MSVIALITDSVQRRRTTAARLELALERRSRHPHRDLLERLLDDIGHGTCSVLEHAYLHRVERAHGLPRAVRQKRFVDRRIAFRDVEYDQFGLVVELDGWVGHTRSTDRWRDMERDLLTAADGGTTVRIGWRQVERDPCETAGLIAQILAGRGWTGMPTVCGPQCRLARCNGVALGR